jgi:hypothetical protein
MQTDAAELDAGPDCLFAVGVLGQEAFSGKFEALLDLCRSDYTRSR